MFAGTILPVDWLDHSLKNMAMTEAAIKESQTLRDKMCVTIQVKAITVKLLVESQVHILSYIFSGKLGFYLV